MNQIIILIIISFLILWLFYKQFSNNYFLKQKNKTRIYEFRDYYDKLLKKYMDESFEAIYSRHILPFVSNNMTINTDSKDKFFLSISKIFLQVLNNKLGNMKEDVYLKIFETKENFNDEVLLYLSLKIQDHMVDTVIKNNINTEGKI